MIKFKSKKYNQTTINEIFKMAEKGISDVKIAKELNVSYSIVQKISTRYWEQKMFMKDKQQNPMKMIEERVDNNELVELTNNEEDEILVWFQPRTKNYCLMLNAKIIKATKTWKPIQSKLLTLKTSLK